MNEPEIQRMIGNLARRIARLEALADGRLVRPSAPTVEEDDHPWRCVETGGLGIEITKGVLTLAGIGKAIGSWPTDHAFNATDDATTYCYLETDLSASTCTWKTATTDPGNGDDDTEITVLVEITAADGEVTGIYHRQWSDIAIERTSE
jgi:hypothetical protein